MPDRELLRVMRQQLDAADIDEIVRWQMTGWMNRKAPVVRAVPQPRCHRCSGDWHGLPRENCPGSFDTPNQDN